MIPARSYNREIYETRYSHDDLRIDKLRSGYDREMAAIRLGYLTRLSDGLDVADLGCGTGSYLLPVAERARLVYGIDFSSTLLATCRQRIEAAAARNVRLIQGDLRSLPLHEAAVDLAFSVATLYHVPDVAAAITEASRVLRPRGLLFVELGNRWSLNTLAARTVRSGVISYHISLSQMREALAGAGFTIDEHRSFQILPMYGRPRYLLPLVSARWQTIMGVRFGGKMLDEHISSLPFLRQLAFRHLFLCRKTS